MTPLSAPLLASDRLHALFESGPTDSLVLNFVGDFLGIAAGRVFALLVMLGLFGPFDGTDVLGWAVTVNVAYPALGAIARATVLRRRGYWRASGGGLEGYAALGLGAVWYALVPSVAVTAVVFAAAIAAFPG